MKKLIVHIDDYGVTENYSHDILKAVQNKVVDSISILPNGAYVDQAMALLQSHNVDLSVHLNLVEGKPLSKNSGMLVNSQGEFALGFLKLFLFSFLNPSKKTLEFRQQIKEELRTQIEKIKNFDNKRPLSLDSHRHIHLIPFLRDITLELAEEYQIKSIRLINEPFFLCLSPSKNIKAYFNGNIVKHLIIKLLSTLARKKLIRDGKQYLLENNERFLGILFSDMMSVANIKKGIEKSGESAVRVLFHSGVKLPNENYIGTNQAFLDYYQSLARSNEKNEILSEEFKQLYYQLNQN